jgi:bifunctional non-homologous end joining protein LigD
LKTKRPAVSLKGKNLVFAEPTLIAEIEFRGWMHEGARVMCPTRDWAR